MSLTYPDNINPAALSLLAEYLQTKGDHEKNNIVLELGCSTGALGQHVLKIFPHPLIWIGIDMNEEALAIANSRLTNTFQEDLDNIGVASLHSASPSANVVVMIDVLEHVCEPGRLLHTISVAYPHASVVCVLPNIACYQTYERLSLHDFPYDKSGIFDATHKTFYTAKSALRLFQNEGYNSTKGPIFLLDPPMKEIATTTAEFPFTFKSDRYSITLQTKEDLLSLSSYGFGYIFSPVVKMF